jgi:hypothetical protein
MVSFPIPGISREVIYPVSMADRSIRFQLAFICAISPSTVPEFFLLSSCFSCERLRVRLHQAWKKKNYNLNTKT